MEQGSATVARTSRPSRAKLVAVLIPIAVLVVAGYVGDALTTSWAEDNPLALIALNSRNRILVLTTNQLDALSYYTVGGLRLMLADPLFYLLGVWYGDAAIRWLERRSPAYGDLVRRAERGFGKATYPLVLVAPNAWICMFAGAAGMSVPVFLALNAVGTAGRLALIRVVGETFSSPLDRVLDFFAEYRLQLFIASVVLVVLSVVLQRKGGIGEVSALRDLEHEVVDPDGDLTN